MIDGPKKILVVDDEAQITRVLLRGLESAGYQVRTANDGRAGLESFRTWLPDLVITDLSMPVLLIAWYYLLGWWIDRRRAKKHPTSTT